jgi:hypothetical protein
MSMQAVNPIEAVPLWDPDAERGLVGAVLVNAQEVLEDPDVALVRPEDFHDQTLGRYWRIIRELHDKGQPVTVELVALVLQGLDQAPVAPIGQLCDLAIHCPTTLAAPRFTETVRKDAARRNLQRTASLIHVLASDGRDKDPDVLYAEALALLAGSEPQTQGRRQLEADALLAQDYGENRWLANGLVRKSGKCILDGNPETGKSWLAMQLALCVRYGLPWLGQATQQGNVLYWAGDMSEEMVQARLENLTCGLEVAAPIDGLLFDFSPLALDEPSDVQAMARTVARAGAHLFVIDSLYLCLGRLEENAAGDMGRAMSAVQQIIRAAPDCGAVIIHHSTKVGAGSTGASIRGSSVLWAAADTAFWCESTGPRDARVFLFSEMKNKHTRSGFPSLEFAIQDTDLGVVVTHNVSSRVSTAGTFTEAAAGLMLQSVQTAKDRQHGVPLKDLETYARANGWSGGERTLKSATKLLVSSKGVHRERQGPNGRYVYWWQDEE